VLFVDFGLGGFFSLKKVEQDLQVVEFAECMIVGFRPFLE